MSHSDILMGGGYNFLTVRKLISFLPLIAVSVISCKRDETLDVRNSEYISFKINDDALSVTGTLTKGTCDTLSYEITDWDYTGEESESDVETKGTLTESLSGEVGVFAVWNGDTGNPVMSNAKHTVNGSELVPATKVLWKNYNSGTMAFFAYAPYDKDLAPGYESSKPYFTYTVPTDVSKQKDILYATASKPCSKSDRTATPLDFRHGLTAIQFRMGFACTVKSVSIQNVANTGKFYLDGTAPVVSGTQTYTIDFGSGKSVAEGEVFVDGTNTLIMVPQSFTTDSPKIQLVYNDGTKDYTISAQLKDSYWPAGKKVIYTINKQKTTTEDDYIYFDLALGSVIFTETTYKGWVYAPNSDHYVTISGTHNPGNKYYIYQSTMTSYPYDSNTGYKTMDDANNHKNCRVPVYNEVTYNGQKWGDYITNNTDVEAVEANWISSAKAAGRDSVGTAVVRASLDPISFRIVVCGNSTYDITIDNIWTENVGHDYGGFHIGGYSDIYDVSQRPYNAKVTLRLKGDNKFHKIFYNKPVDGYKGGSYKGSFKITSADGDGLSSGTLTVTWPNNDSAAGSYIEGGTGYYGGLIGAGNAEKVVDHSAEYGAISRQCDGIEFAGGTVYVGSKETSGSEWAGPDQPVRNNRCCIGGTNAYNGITISGGRLTAVSHSTSAAIGGGGGHDDPVAKSRVTITGGDVYAYSYPVYSTAVQKMIPTTAIGGGSSSAVNGPDAIRDYTYSGQSEVTISGGNVYAQSFGGSAIGGGNLSCRAGASATVNITGGSVIAISSSYHFVGDTKDTILLASTAIGGGAAGGARGYKSGTSGGLDDASFYNGGTATLTIGGSANVKTGSVGGGTTGWPLGKVGSAQVTVSGGQISGQFIMAKGAVSAPSFTINGGTVNNSSTDDATYIKMKPNGGAVYMESGTCTVNGGTIEKCSADTAGAIFMNGGTFTMTGGTISNCSATTHGGAVYIDGGDATVSGGEIKGNLASAGNGGGVYVSAGNFSMPDGSKGKINNNSADASSASTDGNGGGIYVHSTSKNVNVDIIGGEVQYNAADRNGGGLCVDMPNTGVNATITIGKSGGVATSPNIALNSAALSGGGMAVQGSGSNIYIYSGTVKGNVSAYVKNEDIRNDGGMVDLVGKNSPGVVDHVDVNYKTITFYANNGYDPEPYDEQRVITSTNSPLTPTATALAFEKEFYKKVSWNTKRDGSGVTYNLNGTGEVMNITSDLSLYAQWVENK